MAQQSTPQVGLFGSIYGEWREKHIIPVLDELKVSYFHPGTPDQVWTEEMGKREAEVMQQAETIVMVINDEKPAFGGLGETGWAALGAVQRKQTLILYVQPGYTWRVPAWQRWLPGMKNLIKEMEDYAQRTRSLVTEHAKRHAQENERLIVVDSLAGVVAELKRLYSR